jgi:hypothetical protein
MAIALGLQLLTPSYSNAFNKMSLAVAIIIFIIFISILAYMIKIIKNVDKNSLKYINSDTST